MAEFLVNPTGIHLRTTVFFSRQAALNAFSLLRFLKCIFFKMVRIIGRFKPHRKQVDIDLQRASKVYRKRIEIMVTTRSTNEIEQILQISDMPNPHYHSK